MTVEEIKTAGATASLTHHTITVLLIDDQAMIGEAVRRMLLGEADIRFHYCSNPGDALRVAGEVSPTVILQDLVMPDIDGLTLVRMFRQNQETKDVPLIVLSTKEEAKVKAEAFALGANDYLVKLPDRIELIARIRYHSQGFINLLQRNEAYEALIASQKALAAELAQAAEYVTSLLPDRLQGEVRTEWKFIPSVELGGDSFGYHWLDPDHFAMYLLDVCGHGVRAALLSISVMNVLRSQTLPSTDFYRPEQVLTTLNNTFQMEQQHNMYFTIWYGIYNRPNRRLLYSSGGHPPALLFSGSDAAHARPVPLKLPGFIIGGLPGVTFESGEVELEPYSRLYVFSDGVYEINRPDGTMMTFDEFVQIMAEPLPEGESGIDRALQTLRRVQGRESFEDDFSMVEIVLG